MVLVRREDLNMAQTDRHNTERMFDKNPSHNIFTTCMSDAKCITEKVIQICNSLHKRIRLVLHYHHNLFYLNE